MLPPPKPSTSTERSFVLPEDCTEVLYLLGTSRLTDFLTYARERTNLSALSGAGGDSVMMELAEAWRNAAFILETLTATDPYPEEPPLVFPIPENMRDYCDKLLAKPQVQRAFDRVPIAMAMVPLAPLICTKQRIRLRASQVKSGDATLGLDDSLLTTCLPLHAAVSQPQIAQQSLKQDEGSVTFTSDSDELQIFSPRVVTADAIGGVWPGDLQQALTLPVGYSTHLFNVIRFEDRMVLNDGYQRAIALHRRGVTHVPAIIQVCRHREDIRLVGSPEMMANEAAYFQHERPPQLKDFSDRRLTISLAAHKSRNFVRIKYQIETGYFHM